MSLTKEMGRFIREEYSGNKERLICEKHNLKQIGGSKTKVDGTNGIHNKSIKNAKGNSTQVHLTTQKHFIKQLDIKFDCKTFIEFFCGHPSINNKGKDRFFIPDIDYTISDKFKNFLNKNKTKIVEIIISNGFNITHVIYNDIKNNIEYEISYDDILKKIKNTEWVFLKGGIHLKNSNGKSYFHFQREGKKSLSNRYNVLWHIHKHLFID
jgi:hypothetical protein